MMRQPIHDDQGNIIGSYDPDFFKNLPDELYRLVKFSCLDCDAEFLMDLHFVKAQHVSIVNCPICGSESEAISATNQDDEDVLMEWGCAYPNPPSQDEEETWLNKRLEEDES